MADQYAQTQFQLHLQVFTYNDLHKKVGSRWLDSPAFKSRKQTEPLVVPSTPCRGVENYAAISSSVIRKELTVTSFL